MTMPAAVPAAWALYGKRPGSSSDYGVIAAGGEGFKVALFDRIIVGFSPGNSPVPGMPGPAALPWASFGAVTIDDRDFAVVLVRDWSGLEDSAQRPIAFTRCFCVPFDALDGRAARFTDLYNAAQGIELDWDVPDPFAGPAAALPLPSAAPPQDDPLRVMGELQAMTAAATVLERAVALLARAPSAIDARLAVLDVVPLLLPAGARRWLSASTWAESNAPHRFHLAFTQRARENDRRVEPQGEADPPPPGAPASYRAELDRLWTAKGPGAVVRYLEDQVDCRRREPVVVLDRLSELDLPGALVRAVNEGTLRVSQVRRLDELGRVAELERDGHLVLVLAAYLTAASAEDLRADRALLGRHWREPLGAELGRVAHQRLWAAGGWTYGDLLLLSELAVELRCLPEMAGHLAVRPDERPGVERRTVAARWIGHLDGEYPLEHVLADVVAGHAGLAVAVLRGVLDRPDLARSWVRRLDATSSGFVVGGWSEIAGPFRIALLDAPGELDVDQLDALNRIDPEIVPGLAVYLADRRPGREPGFFRRMFDKLLAVYRRAVSAASVDVWSTSMLRLAADDPELQARWDVETLVTGRPMRHRLVDSVMAGHQVRPAYVDAFVAAASQVAREPSQIGTLLRAVVEQLPATWSAPPERFVAVLDLLRRVGQGRLGSSRLTTDAVLDAVGAQIAIQPELARRPEFEPWYAEIETHREELLGPLVLAQLTGLPPDAPLVSVAQLVATALRSGETHEQIIDALARSECRPRLEELAPLTVAVAEELLRRPGRRHVESAVAYQFGHALARTTLAGRLGAATAATAREHLPAVVVRHAFAHAIVLQAVVESNDDLVLGQLELQRDNVRHVVGRLERTLDALERWSRSRRGRIESIKGMLGFESTPHRRGHH